MSGPINIVFQFLDGGVHDASVSEISVTQEICFNYSWLLNPVISGLDQNPTYTLEASHENVPSSFKPYDVQMLDAAIDQAFDDDHLAPVWFRINYNAQTNTIGTVEFPLILKK